MATGAHGHIDFGDDGFVARCDDPEVVARMKEIQRCHQLRDSAAWIVPLHWPSVRRLLHIALDLGWSISPAARSAQARVQQDSESLEYSLDVVHGHCGEAWFVCQVGDDDALRLQMKALPGAYWEDGWRIPTDWEQCCLPLLDLVQADLRIEVSDAAWRLLEEPDVSHEFIRSSPEVESQH